MCGVTGFLQTPYVRMSVCSRMDCQSKRRSGLLQLPCVFMFLCSYVSPNKRLVGPLQTPFLLTFLFASESKIN